MNPDRVRDKNRNSVRIYDDPIETLLNHLRTGEGVDLESLPDSLKIRLITLHLEQEAQKREKQKNVDELAEARNILGNVYAIPGIEQDFKNAEQFIDGVLNSHAGDPETPTIFLFQHLPGSGKSTMVDKAQKLKKNHHDRSVRQASSAELEFDVHAENLVGEIAVNELLRRDNFKKEIKQQITSIDEDKKKILYKLILPYIDLDQQILGKMFPEMSPHDMQTFFAILKKNPINEDLDNLLELHIQITQGLPLTEKLIKQAKSAQLENLLDHLPERYTKGGTHSDTGKHSEYPPDSDVFLSIASSQYLRRIIQELKSGTNIVFGHASAGTMIITDEFTYEARAYANLNARRIKEILGDKVRLAVCSIAPGMSIIFINDVIRTILQEAGVEKIGDQEELNELLMRLGDESEVSQLNQLWGGRQLAGADDIVKRTSGGSPEVIALANSIEAKLIKKFGLHLKLHEKYKMIYDLAIMDEGDFNYSIVLTYFEKRTETSPPPIEDNQLVQKIFESAVELADKVDIQDPVLLVNLVRSAAQSIVSGDIQRILAGDPDYSFFGLNDPKLPEGVDAIGGKALLQQGVKRMLGLLKYYKENQPD